MLPIILTLATNNAEMFTYLWDHPMLWNKPIYLINLSSIVFETQNPSIISVFLTSDKCKRIFNAISLAEK